MMSAARHAAIGLLLSLSFVASAGAQQAPAVGDKAPDFRLQDQNGKWHALGDYRGKWVVMYFYPKDNTPGCTTQACELRDNMFAFRELGAVVLGVSVDDVASHKAFAEEHGLPFPLLADADKQVTTRYGVLTRYMSIMELARRDTFIIDPEGRIAKHYMKVDPEGHSAMVLAELKRLGAKPAAGKSGRSRRTGGRPAGRLPSSPRRGSPWNASASMEPTATSRPTN